MLGLGLNMATAASQDSGVNRVAPYANNYSAQLDGVDDVIPLGLSDAQMSALHSDSFSVSFWVRRKAWATSFLFGFDDPTASSQESFTIRYLNIGNSYLQTSVGHNGSTLAGLALITAPATNTWIHIAASVTKGTGSAAGNAKFYINGTQAISQNTASGTNHAAASIASGFDYVVGARQTASTPTYDGYTKGNFDEIALWDDALSAAEITAIYNSGSTFDLRSDNGDYTSSSNLQYYYRLENNFSDTMGNAADATNPSGGVIFQDSSTIATP